MRLCHARAAISVRFDDPNLVSCAGLAPVMALAARCGLTALVEGLTVAGKVTANAAAKITTLVAGMVAGADSISDMDLLRHGGMGRVFDRGAGSVHSGHVPAPVHLRSRPPTRRRGRRAVGPSRRRQSKTGVQPV
jgi:hypothetical protein